MATDSTLQKIADNLLAQFDKTLLDNSTDFSSCDQILNAAPSEHKGGLESLYCDLLLDALISGYYRYSEMDTKQLVDDPLYTKFKKMVYGLDRSDPYNLLYYAIIDLVSGKKENVLQYLSAYLDEKIKSLKTESGIFTAEDFTYILVVPLKEGFPGMWSAIGRMLDRDDVEAGIPEMCAALDHLYYDSKNESIIESLTQVLQCNPKILLAKELLGYTYYNMQMLEMHSHILSNLKMENPHLAFSLRAPSTSGWHGATERKRTVSRKKNTIGSHLRLFLSAKIP